MLYAGVVLVAWWTIHFAVVQVYNQYCLSFCVIITLNSMLYFAVRLAGPLTKIYKKIKTIGHWERQTWRSRWFNILRCNIVTITCSVYAYSFSQNQNWLFRSQNCSFVEYMAFRICVMLQKWSLCFQPFFVPKFMFYLDGDPANMSLLSLIHIWRCRRIERCRSRWSPYH